MLYFILMAYWFRETPFYYYPVLFWTYSSFLAFFWRGSACISALPPTTWTVTKLSSMCLFCFCFKMLLVKCFLIIKKALFFMVYQRSLLYFITFSHFPNVIKINIHTNPPYFTYSLCILEKFFWRLSYNKLKWYHKISRA